MSRTPGALAASAAVVISLSSCANPPRAPTRSPPVVEARWQDVFDVAPELLLVIRPNALRASGAYGPLLKRVQELARERSRVVAATCAMDAIEDADEVVFGLYSIGGDGADADDFIAAVLGVRADIDPATLVDSDGHPLWTAGPSGPVRELVRQRDQQGLPIDASLFELPGRTWVIAAGPARARAREALARPRGRPDPVPIAADALAVLRLDGPSLSSRVPALHAPSPLAPLGRGLQWVSLELATDTHSPVQALLAYSTAGAAAAAESVARDALDAVRRRKPEGFAWIGDATIGRPSAGAAVVLSAPLPSTWLVPLSQASGSNASSASAP
ncbi:MAG TPA: hypothetical protein VEK07_16940 [Polyangiaceae bacterium]|nr:hypothetical protein [Polyangiaceae bacterium]